MSAVDFLLKPIIKDRLNQALEKANRTLLRELALPSLEAIQKIHRLTEARDAIQTSYLQRVAGQRKSKIYLLQIWDIQAFVCTDEQVYAVTGDRERSMLNHTLKYLEARLSPNSFVRVHKQAIVNIACVAEIEQTPKGDGFAKLTCGLTVELSRRYVALLKEKLAC